MKLRILVALVLLVLLMVPLAGCSGQESAPQEAVAVDGAQDAAGRDDVSDDVAPPSALDKDTDDVADVQSSVEKVDAGDKDEAETEDSVSVEAPDIRSLDTLDSYRQTMTTRTVSDGEVTEWTLVMEFVRDPAATRMVWTSVDEEGEEESWETVQIGTTTYMRGDENDEGQAEWISYTSEDAEEPEAAADITNWVSAGNYLDDPSCSRKGREEVDGQGATLYVCDAGVFGAYSSIWGATGKLIEGSVQTWVSDEYNVALRSISEWIGEDDEGIRHEYRSEAVITDINEPFTIEAPAGVDAPGLPDDVPLYPGATMTMAMAGIVGFEVEAALADVSAFYREQMEVEGWTLDSEYEGMLNYSKDGRTAMIMLSESDDLIEGSIMVQ